MKRPIIGIIGRPNIIMSGYSVMSVNDTLRSAIINAGGNPIMILPPQNVDYEEAQPRLMERLTEEEKEVLIDQIKLCDGIVMPGGFKWYEYDLFIAKYLVDNDIPTLGLCMGMQLLAYVDNIGKEVENNNLHKIESDIKHFQTGVPHVHDVEIKKDTKLYEIFNTNKLEVNSRHNYAVTNINNAIVSAYSTDKVIEAIEFPDKKFIVGIQWHPESILGIYPENQKIFDKLVEKSQK